MRCEPQFAGRIVDNKANLIWLYLSLKSARNTTISLVAHLVWAFPNNTHRLDECRLPTEEWSKLLRNWYILRHLLSIEGPDDMGQCWASDDLSIHQPIRDWIHQSLVWWKKIFRSLVGLRSLRVYFLQEFEEWIYIQAPRIPSRGRVQRGNVLWTSPKVVEMKICRFREWSLPIERAFKLLDT